MIQAFNFLCYCFSCLTTCESTDGWKHQVGPLTRKPLSSTFLYFCLSRKRIKRLRPSSTFQAVLLFIISYKATEWHPQKRSIQVKLLGTTFTWCPYSSRVIFRKRNMAIFVSVYCRIHLHCAVIWHHMMTKTKSGIKITLTRYINSQENIHR